MYGIFLHRVALAREESDACGAEDDTAVRHGHACAAAYQNARKQVISWRQSAFCHLRPAVLYDELAACPSCSETQSRI